MNLSTIKTDTVLHLCDSTDRQVPNRTWKTAFYDLSSENNFFVKDKHFYRDFPSIANTAGLDINFYEHANMYSFTGRPLRVTQRNGVYLTLMEQLSEIVSSSRRSSPREPLTINVLLYGLPQAELPNASHVLINGKRVEFSASTLDISTGGLCLVSKHRLHSAFDPYFLAAFTLNTRDVFLLPAKLVRCGNCPQIGIYQYDYGFQFIYDTLPHEQERLTSTLLNAKLSSILR